jgi:hypothetical protein
LAALIAAISYALFKKSHKKRFYGQTFDATSVQAPNEDESVKLEKLTPQKRRAGVTFLSIWLIFWTIGVVLAAREWLSMTSDGTNFKFLSLWLAFAIPAWGIAAWILFRLLRGDEVEFYLEDGD